MFKHRYDLDRCYLFIYLPYCYGSGMELRTEENQSEQLQAAKLGTKTLRSVLSEIALILLLALKIDKKLLTRLLNIISDQCSVNLNSYGMKWLTLFTITFNKVKLNLTECLKKKKGEPSLSTTGIQHRTG